MAKDLKFTEEKLSKKLDLIVELLQTLIVLQAAGMKVKKQDIRKIAKTAMNRVTEITGFIKEDSAVEDKKSKHTK